jgi:hypothetical protein
MAGFNSITVKAGNDKLVMDVETARKLMMKLEEVLRVEHDTLEVLNTPKNLNDWIYFPSGESIALSLVYIPLINP